MTMTNYFAAALIAVAPTALMAEDYNVGADLSLGYAFNEDDDSEATIATRVYTPIMGGFGVQTDLEITENDSGVTTFGGTLHAAYEITPDLAVGMFYGQTDFDGVGRDTFQGYEVTAGFGAFEVSAASGLINYELDYYVFDTSVGLFENYTVGARFDKFETVDMSSSLYVSRELGNGYGLEVRVTDIEEIQDRAIGFTLTKAIGGGARFGSVKPYISTMALEPRTFGVY